MAFSAFLDTCVLVPSVLRDLMLELACTAIYRPLWSDEIERELAEVVRRRHALRGRDQAETLAYIAGLLSRMNAALPDARITAWQHSVAGLTDLPDADDRHVVAAALAGRADVIVTFNLKDFPAHALPGALFAQDPDVFLQDLLGLAPQVVLACLETISSRTGRKGPSMSVSDLLARLTVTGVPKFALDVEKLVTDAVQ